MTARRLIPAAIALLISLHLWRVRKDGGLAVLYGNIAEDGCIVKTAGVDMSMFDAEQLRYTTSVPTSTRCTFESDRTSPTSIPRTIT